MTTKCRISAIRLSQKIDRNPEYAAHIGIRIVNGKADDTGAKNVQNREHDILLREALYTDETKEEYAERLKRE